MQGKWPEKIKYYYSTKGYPDNCVEAANRMHDAFMKVIEAKSDLVNLDENEIKEMIHDRTHYTEECSREIAQNICSKFGQSKPNVPSVEEIQIVLNINLFSNQAQAIHDLLVKGIQ